MTTVAPKRGRGRPKGCSCPKLPCPVHPDKGDGPPVGAPASAGDPGPQTPPGSGWAKLKPPAPSERPPDPKPTRKKTKKRRPTTSELESVLAELLVLPAIPAKSLLGCDYCMMHFVTEGPKAAHELAVLAEENEALRNVLERIHAAMTAITWTAVIGSYVAKPVLHHVAPGPMLAAVGPVIGVPPRPPKRKHEHAYANTAETAAGAPGAHAAAA